MGYQIDLDRTHQRKDSSSLFIKSLASWEGAEEERRITTDFAGGRTLKRCVKLGVASLGRSPLVPPPPPQSFTVSFHLTATAKYLNVWPFCKYRIGIPHQGVFVSISSLPHPLWSGCAFTPLSRIRVPCGEGRTEGVQGRGENSEVGFEPRTLVSNFSFCLHVDCFFFFFLLQDLSSLGSLLPFQPQWESMRSAEHHLCAPGQVHPHPGHPFSPRLFL